MNNMDSTSSSVILPTVNDGISATAFYALNWILFALCNIAFATRAYIRYVCFRRLLLEDYVMLLALAMHNAEAVLIQLYVRYAYDIEALEKGDFTKFGPDLNKGFVAVGACVNITIVGVLLVKLNFLLFFRRLGANIQRFTIIWWAVTLFTVAAAVAQIGMQLFGCFFGGLNYIFSEQCTDAAAMQRIFLNAIFSATVDAISDFLIVGFPVAVLWGSRISIKKKLVLTFVFGLVFLTIAITIVRGSIFHGVYSSTSEEGRMQSATFTWFWFYCEYSVAFIIACIVSFRTLFVQRENKNNERLQEQQRREAAYQSAIRRGKRWRAKALHFHDSVLDTCRTLEGWSGSEAETLSMRRLPGVPSGLMTVDFNDDGNWSRSVTKDGPDADKIVAARPV
ncbi:hypothetical protein F4813DRAFT_371097 [Daldinia decipiens]|uniref:uncharacterized protein n=1 Tax=Daldinia decipiens TaxID=326647 RepID=UPI0020C5269E|nr:uncharacterized protein F4813DRAFT_371097 [Daldinia decipiens]KAI1654487.1 hypothetical protein F4813DRAFT_371097 [Daldinia decipiens]